MVQGSDGCYKWVIVFCSFINHMATSGAIMSLSVLYVSWLEEFKKGNGKTSWILSLEFALHLGFSPVTASLTSRFGFRTVAFVGGLLTAFGLGISVFATSVICLIFSIGLISGIGCSFCFFPPYAMISLLFHKHRSLALGIATTGVGVGAFVISPLLDVLVDTYSWRGALLVMAAMSLNMCATGLLLRPVQYTIVDTNDQESFPLSPPNVEEEDKDLASYEKLAVPRVTNGHDAAALRYCEDTTKVSLSMNLNTTLASSAMSNYEIQREHGSWSDIHFKSATLLSPSLSLPTLTQHHLNLKRQFQHTSFNYLQTRDIVLLASMNPFSTSSKECVSGKEKTTETEIINHESEVSQSSLKDSNWWFSGSHSWLDSITHLKVFQDRIFLLFCFSNLLTNISFLAPIMYFVDRAIHHGIERSVGAIIISAYGVGNILGRLITGLIATDRCCSNRILAYIAGLCANGLGTVLSPMCGGNAILHGIYATYFGFHIGAYIVLMPMVTADLNGTSNLASVMGQVLAFHGIGILIGSPISGWLFDWTQSYVVSYIVNGVFLIVSGVILLPLLQKSDKNKCLNDS